MKHVVSFLCLTCIVSSSDARHEVKSLECLQNHEKERVNTDISLLLMLESHRHKKKKNNNVTVIIKKLRHITFTENDFQHTSAKH